ncbi:MAG TPA: hypothetical protein VFZ08_15445, partial [Terriglobia bacterium]|nr:hypothetical protein [Terriglobia bacterium]
ANGRVRGFEKPRSYKTTPRYLIHSGKGAASSAPTIFGFAFCRRPGEGERSAVPSLRSGQALSAEIAGGDTGATTLLSK